MESIVESKLFKKVQTERIESRMRIRWCHLKIYLSAANAADVIKNLEVDFVQKSVLHGT
jgi:hypothetical protein